METILTPFRRDLKTKNLELRIIKPAKGNAKDFWNVIKNENPDDFKYIRFSLDDVAPLPISEQETFDLLVKYHQETNRISYAVYNNNNLIGFARAIYWDKIPTLEIGL